MARRIQKDDGPALADDAVSTNVLRNPASFTGRHIGLTDGVKKGRLTMVNVTHDGNNRRTRLAFGRIVLDFRKFRRILLRRRFLDFTVEVHAHKFGRFMVDFLVDGHHLPQKEELLDDFIDIAAQEFGKVLDTDALAYFNARRTNDFSLFFRCGLVVVFMFMVFHHMICTA